MKKIHLLPFLFTATILMTSCKSKQSISAIALSATQELFFLDSLQATQAIIIDDKENFFDHIGILDMSIQMKKAFPEDANRETVLTEYKQFLQKDVLSFTLPEKTFLEGIFKKVLLNCNKVSQDLLGAETRLVKTHANHYGASVYYTRENIIVIPKHVLAEKNEEAVYGTMLHELFHIYSRYHPKEQAALYDLIGFKDIGSITNLQIDPALKKRILINPDGVDYSFAIRLDIGEQQPILAIPIIHANTTRYETNRPHFFDYLDFGLFKISPPYSKMIKVHSTTEGNTVLKQDQLGDFFRQIKDNTQYIIHPDEIMADNFMFLINSKEEPDFLNQFSESGQQLIKDIEEILRK